MGKKKKVLKKLAKANKGIQVPYHDDPREELRMLVKRHKSLMRAKVALTHMASDRISKSTGEKILCLLPEAAQVDIKECAKKRGNEAGQLETAMRRQLKRIPIYTEFLDKVYGCGVVVSAYIVAEVDIHFATKSSALRRFMGLAVIDGKLERRTRGQKNAYNSEMRTRLYQMFDAMRKNTYTKDEEGVSRQTKSTKYLRIWSDYKRRVANMAEPMKKAKAESNGRWKAADVFVEDLYLMWRTLEGLEAWPTYTAAKLGYAHGGIPCDGLPRLYTLDEARAKVGYVGAFDIEADAAE